MQLPAQRDAATPAEELKGRRPALGRLYQIFGGPFARALGTTVLANLIFLVLVILSPADPDLIANRVRTAFDTGELGLVDYLPFDSRRGWHQYNDCVVLQMLSDTDPSQVGRALAPAAYGIDEDSYGACSTLYALTMGDADRQTLLPSRYARYWHGYNVPTVLALRVMELKDFRQVLSGAVWLAIGTLAVATLRSGPRTRQAGLIIALTAALVWAVPYFAPGITHGPGDALLLFALAGIAAWPRTFSGLGVIIPYAAGFGAAVVFFEMLTGQLPVAAAWLVALTLAKFRDSKQPAGARASAVALATLVAFGLGAATTVMVKQVLASVLIEPNASAQFVTQLGYYMGMPDYEPGWPGFLEPFGRLVNKSDTLTFGNELGSYGLIAIMVVACLAAAIRGWRWRRSGFGQDMLILVGAALIPVAWVLLLPRHTYIHAVFMVRLLVVPVSLPLVALCWPRMLDQGRAMSTVSQSEKVLIAKTTLE